ncbi:MAG: PAS domain S-box protein [Acidobacteria bacterium]|nr:MAG: PAS domain S-box protein [Acidobacteriota bacterium]
MKSKVAAMPTNPPRGELLELNRLYEAAPVGLCLLDHELRYVRINERLAAINGRPVSEHIGRTFQEIIPELGPTLEPVLRRVIETGEAVVNIDIHGMTRAEPRVERDWLASYYPVTSKDGILVGISAVVQDVTEHKQAERALWAVHEQLETRVQERTRELQEANAALITEVAQRRRAEALFKGLLEAAPDAMIMSDKKGKIALVNAQTERLLGYAREELIGRSVETLLPGLFRKRHLVHRTDYIADSRFRMMGEGGDLFVRSKDGREIPVEISLSPFESEEGLLVLSSIRDVTERKRQQEEIEKSEARFRLLAESTNVVPWEADARTWLFTYVGPQAVKLLGYPVKRWYDEDFWVEHIHPEDREYTIDFCMKSSLHCRDFEFEYRMRASDGRYVWLHDVVHVETVEGGPRTLMGFMIDVTDRNRVREALRALSARLIDAQEKERGRIARELHDNIGQKLALLAVELDITRQSPPGSETELSKQLEKLSGFTKELSSDIHRLSHRLHPRSIEKLGLSVAIRRLCREVADGHEVRIDFSEERVPSSFSDDTALCLFRVAQESLRNTVKHSQAKEVLVELSGGIEEIRLRISDSGIGFNPDDITEKEGLGLDSMRERLRAVGGTLAIESDPGRGTRVEAAVPVR